MYSHKIDVSFYVKQCGLSRTWIAALNNDSVILH